MTVPLQVTFRDMESTPALEEFVGKWASKLEHVYDRIERCHVLVERPHQHQRQGQNIHVRITLAVPGPDVIVSHDHAVDGSHEDAYVAIRDAFRAARRQLEDHARRLRRDVKVNRAPS
jgi:ribosomal subunit interface protein